MLYVVDGEYPTCTRAYYIDDLYLVSSKQHYSMQKRLLRVLAPVCACWTIFFLLVLLEKKLTADKFFVVKFLSKLITLGMIAMVSEIEDLENCDAHGCLFLLPDIM